MLNQNLNETWKVRNIEMEGIIYRLYNEETTTAEFALNLETVYKIHKLIEKYNFNLYHIKTSPKTSLTLKFNSDGDVDSCDIDVKKIKFFQANDFYYLYMNIFFEVFYSIPHVNEKNNYSYEMLILVEKDFDIKKISEHNFNLINIKSCEKIDKEKVTFSFIESFFGSRSIIKNNYTATGEYDYDIFPHQMGHEEFVKNHNNGNPEYDHQLKRCFSSFKFVNEFNQNFYAQVRFKHLCTHIWDFGCNYFIEENKYGKKIQYDDLYESVGCFFTNFGELNKLKVADVNETIVKFKDVEHYLCTISENYDQLDIFSCSLSKEFVLNNFIDTNNKEIRVQKKDEITSINNIIV